MRKAISKVDQDYLWSESAGHCQNPNCRRDIHEISARTSVVELAHIIPASRKGPRGEFDGHLDDKQRADRTNILLLCPTCHTAIDKDPENYAVELLRQWKRFSIQTRGAAFGTPRYSFRSEARAAVEGLLAVNHEAFERYGPTPDSFYDDDRAERWKELVRSTILPNNEKMLAIVEANQHLLKADEITTSASFRIHVDQLRRRHLYGDWSAGTITFPEGMNSIFEGE